MFKDILMKCSDLAGRPDISQTIKSCSSVDEIDNPQIQNEVIKLIAYFNFTVSSIFQSYIDLFFTDTIASDENNKIYFYNFTFNPIQIMSVVDEKLNISSAKIYSGYVLTNSPNKIYKITYKHLPCEIKDLNSDLNFPKILNKKIICYGVVSEYFASKNMFSESNFWRNRFMYEIFKAKTHKERRVKSTFRL